MVTKQDILKLLQTGINPQQIVMGFLQKNSAQNPMMSNLLTLAQQGKEADILTIAQNLAKQRGVDFDKAFEEFKNFLGVQ